MSAQGYRGQADVHPANRALVDPALFGDLLLRKPTAQYANLKAPDRGGGRGAQRIGLTFSFAPMLALRQLLTYRPYPSAVLSAVPPQAESR